jgi:hypothetical protein
MIVTEKDSPSVLRERISVRGLRLKWPTCIAMRRKSLVVVEGRDLLVTSPNATDERSMPGHVQLVGWHPGSVAFSPSLKYVMLCAEQGNYSELWDLQNRKPLVAVAGPERVAATVLMVGNKEVLVCSRRAGMLEGFVLPELQPAFFVKCMTPLPFVFSALVPLGTGDTFAAIGHRLLESEDRLLLLSTRAIAADANVVEKGIEAPEAKGAGLQVGPCGKDGMVLYRDPAARRAPGTLNVLRLADREVLEVVEQKHPLQPYSTLMATAEAITIAGRTSLEILPRSGFGEERLAIAVRSCALDPDSGQTAVVLETGELQLLKVNGTRSAPPPEPEAAQKVADPSPA